MSEADVPGADPGSDPAPPLPAALRHTALEDVLGLGVGTFVISLGLWLLSSADLVTGGTAGLSLLLSYALPVQFGTIFILVNLPFFLLAIRRKGWDFTVRTGVSIMAVSLLSELHPLALGTPEIAPLYATIGGNVLAGVGLIILFRHKASLGGFSILALVLQEQAGWRAGYVLMVLDAIIVLASLAVTSLTTTLVSAIGVVVINLILAFNHRPGRYTAEPASLRLLRRS